MSMSSSSRKEGGLFSLARSRFQGLTAKPQHVATTTTTAATTTGSFQLLQEQQPQQQAAALAEAGAKRTKYASCTRQDVQLDDELQDIAVVSGVQSGQLTYGRGTATANGPRVVPGIITSTRLMEDHLNSSRSRTNAPAPTTSLLVGLEKTQPTTTDNLLAVRSTGTEDGGQGSTAEADEIVSAVLSSARNRAFSKHSILDVVSNRITAGVSNNALKSKRLSGESLSSPFIQPAAKASPRGKPQQDACKHPVKGKVQVDSNGSSGYRNGCNWTFVFDPAGQLCYYWSMVVSLAFLYNFWVLIYRFAFEEITGDSLVLWLCLDYFCDLVYVLDIAFHFRTGYLEDGVLQTDTTRLRHHYVNSTVFYIDCLSLLPLDFMYLSIGFNSMLRCFRLLKIYRFWAFMDRTERHTNYPNLFRAGSLIHYLLVIYHWNACVSHIVTDRIKYNQVHRELLNHTSLAVSHDKQPGGDSDVTIQYLRSYYWCTLMMTTMGDVPQPQTKDQYVFVISQLIFGLMLFATVLGHVSSIVINVSAARKEFQAKLDAVKTYMRMRRVPEQLQVKVIKWFDYLWLTHKSSDEEKAVGGLPDKLKAEIAIHVHLNTLKRVEIFQNTEAGFLCELVLRLKPVLFSPGDYICRKGEVGKEMYIVNRGRLQVVADNGRTVLATLKAGSYFGEISILNMGTAGNRRTASVRSVGYSDLFVLSKKDMWDVLKEYPAARVRLEAIAVKRLEKYKRAPLQKAAMGRSRSAPGLIESRGRIPLEQMQLPEVAPYKPAWNPGSEQVTCTVLPRVHGTTCSSTDNGHSGATSRRSSILPTSAQRTSDIPFPYRPQIDPQEDARFPGRASRLPSQDFTTPSWTISSTHTPLLHHPAEDPANNDIASLSTASFSMVYRSQQTTTTHFGTVGTGEVMTVAPAETLVSEISRLRRRLQLLESENAALSTKLSRQQWELENRLAEIEMQICGVSSPLESTNEDNECNVESAI